MKTTHTHRGTCQACGSRQAVDNVSGLIAKHGYKAAALVQDIEALVAERTRIKAAPGA